MANMIEVVIDSVRVSLMSPQRVVVLRQADADRYLPIWVGPYEAEAITVALQEIEMVRPLTHDLLKSVFTSFNARIKRVEIVTLREDIFYGNIVAEVDGREVNVDSRPSDAIALAVRAHVPILVNPSVMESAGILPEQDMPANATAEETGGGGPAPEVSSDRLSIFEDFLDKLDLDKLDDKDKGKDNPDKPDKPDDEPPPSTT
ncbi:MAG: bifunctional nuclease family protein [Bacteroidota bacterium]